ncbi:helicase [Cutibacterium acnes JCM 18909]|nr:helicase [Cutibacterium acnes JCM 18909]
MRTVALTRSLTTQAVVLPLPASIVTGDMFALPSLRAALLLGLREQFGGTPDHLGIMPIKEPVDDRTRDALLLHDLVPGGTGYLAEFTSPQNVWEALRRAFQIVHDCPCKDEERLACHRCLLPLASAREARYVSRAKAEDCLKVLMGLADGDTPSTQMTWEIATTPPTISSDDESYLESRFRESFMALARRLNATVSQNYGPAATSSTCASGKCCTPCNLKYSCPAANPISSCAVAIVQIWRFSPTGRPSTRPRNATGCATTPRNALSSATLESRCWRSR